VPYSGQLTGRAPNVEGHSGYRELELISGGGAGRGHSAVHDLDILTTHISWVYEMAVLPPFHLGQREHYRPRLTNAGSVTNVALALMHAP
jgi:hypothetical protein